ncbi:unnamed protein product, partial [Ilex paraguariensis]
MESVAIPINDLEVVITNPLAIDLNQVESKGKNKVGHQSEGSSKKHLGSNVKKESTLNLSSLLLHHTRMEQVVRKKVRPFQGQAS